MGALVFYALARRAKKTDLHFNKQLADSGDADAQYRLGVIYCQGINVPQNYPEAISWLGTMYREGTSVAQDFQEALKWFGKSAE